MNIPNFAACHHCMRLAWSGVGAVELATACARGAAAAVPVIASPAREAPVPRSICRLLMVTFCIINLFFWSIDPCKLSVQIEKSAIQRVIRSGDKRCLIGAEIKCECGNLAGLRHAAD